jgi:uncharacterized protein YcnI
MRPHSALLRAGALTAVLAAGHTGAAAAHIQVRPAQAAPGDPVLWTVLIPSEEEAGTRQVELAVPKDVLPFSFEDQPGWTRRIRPNRDGSVRSIVWRGRTPGDGLATFRFLASAPEREGAIAWKAIQTYRDGDVVRWIGAAGSETPASVTTISRSAPRENAGGESGGAVPAAAAPAGGASTGGSEDGGPDWLARGLGIAALLAALAAAALRRKPGSG